MQRHLSTGSQLLAALMQSDRGRAAGERHADPLHDVMRLLARQDQDHLADPDAGPSGHHPPNQGAPAANGTARRGQAGRECSAF